MYTKNDTMPCLIRGKIKFKKKKKIFNFTFLKNILFILSAYLQIHPILITRVIKHIEPRVN